MTKRIGETTIAIKDSTKDRLMSFGKMGDSYDYVINLIIDKLTAKGKGGTK